MATFLFDEIIFGPVSSRRLGASLGINLLPNDRKVCTFNCIYCECGWTEKDVHKMTFHPRKEVKYKLERRLDSMKKNKEPLDTITFAGNGEPTMHPQFDLIIQDTIGIRNRIFPGAKIAVLSNASLLYKPKIFNALKQVDQSILKLDSVFEETVELINQPYEGFDLKRTIEYLIRFNQRSIIQTMFVKGTYKGRTFDNTTEEELVPLLETIEKINPMQVMIYTIARDTPAEGVEKIPHEVLKQIGKRVEDLGISVQISD